MSNGKNHFELMEELLIISYRGINSTGTIDRREVGVNGKGMNYRDATFEVKHACDTAGERRKLPQVAPSTTLPPSTTCKYCR